MAETPRRTSGRAHLLVVMSLGWILSGCSSLQHEADTGAARIADHVLPDALTRAIEDAGASSPEERLATASEWLTAQPSTLPGQRGVDWAVRDRDETTIRVDVYQYTESGAFLPPDQGEAVWGIACRTYDLARRSAVNVEPVPCPADTPPDP